MPYFIRQDIPIVVYREHEINAEYIDGRLELIKSNEQACVILHTPNTLFSYDLKIEHTGTLEDCWERKNKLVVSLSTIKKPDTPSIYYEVILSKNIDLYKSNFKATKPFLTKEKNELESVPTIRRDDSNSVLRERYEIPDRSIDSKPNQNFSPAPPSPKPRTNPINFIERPLSLVRNSEKAIFTYKSPGQRFS